MGLPSSINALWTPSKIHARGVSGDSKAYHRNTLTSGMVVFISLCRDTKTKATYNKKHLIGGFLTISEG